MILYHFTAREYLRAIGQHGLTVGDVPTDIRENMGRVGVWLTNLAYAEGNGLHGSALDKKRFRLTVDISETSLALAKWTEWAPHNVTADTINRLHTTADNFDSWFIYFGIIRRPAIVSCVDTQSGETIRNWDSLPATPLDRPGIPAWRRDAWHKKLLRNVGRIVESNRGRSEREQ
jgi:hypothetical protein